MKTIVLTGASKGIGYQTALKLLESGCKVIAVARSAEKLEELKSKASSPHLKIIPADLTNKDDIQKILKYVADTNGIDGLINNAGALINKPFSETATDEWQFIFDINLFAPVNLINHLKPYLNRGSHIVNIGSMGGFQGSDKFPGLAAYSSAKGALGVLSECLSTEFSSDDISVNCLCLGAVQTNMLQKAFPGYQAPVQPKEMATYISDFVLNGHKFMNGKILPVALNNPE